MDEKEEARRNRRRLKALLDANNYNAFRFGDSAYLIAFTGKFRDWTIRVHIANGWFCLSTFVLQMPDTPGGRAALLDRAMSLNGKLSMVKFATSENALKLELECRVDRVDAGVCSALLGLYYQTLEDCYPSLFRLAAGDEKLTELQNAYQRTSLTAGADD